MLGVGRALVEREVSSLDLLEDPLGLSDDGVHVLTLDAVEDVLQYLLREPDRALQANMAALEKYRRRGGPRPSTPQTHSGRCCS